MLIKRFFHKSPRAFTKFLTDVSDPDKHTHNHLSYFYQIPLKEADRYLLKSLRKNLAHFSRSLNCVNMMVRSPALEIINNMKAGNNGIKMLIYGENGTGKSMTLASAIHWAARQGWVIIKDPWAVRFNRTRDTELQHTTQNGVPRLDQPILAAEFLQDFKTINETHVSSLKTSEHHTWSKREETPAGTPLVELIDFGLGRVKYAPEIVGVVFDEIKKESESGNIKVLVAVDGVNAYFVDTTFYKYQDDHTRRYKASELTIVQQLRSCVEHKWANGFVVCTLDGNASEPSSTAHLPHQVLGSEGFQSLEPFLPIRTEGFNDAEVYNTVRQYIAGKWLLDEYFLSQPGMDEIVALTGRNPLELFKLPIYL